MSNVFVMDNTVSLDRRADRIRKLMNDWVKNTMAIGAELEKARDQFQIGPRGLRMGWKKWLKDEFNIGETYAQQLIRAHSKFGHLLIQGVEVPSVRVLRFLTQDNIPEVARKEILGRTQKGEKIGRVKAKRIVQKHLPPPKKANEIARKTGTPTAASDGFVYLGATKDEVKESTQRRTVVYAVREAVEQLAAVSINMTADEFLGYALPHQLWTKDNRQQIDQALTWLGALHKALGKRGDE